MAIMLVCFGLMVVAGITDSPVLGATALIGFIVSCLICVATGAIIEFRTPNPTAQVDSTVIKNVNMNKYKVGQLVEVAFSGHYLQDSARYPNPNEIYWIKGKVIESTEKACVVDCGSPIDKVFVLIENEGIRLCKTR